MDAERKTERAEAHEMLRELLTRLRSETQQRIRELRRDQEEEREFEPEDEMESARTSAELETHAGLIARAQEGLRYLEEALARLDAGKYGRCQKCGDTIPIERLMVIPFTAYCVDCQQQLNRTRASWGQGTTIAPYDQQWELPEEMEIPQDREARSTDPEEQLTIYSPEALPPGPSPGRAIRRAPHRSVKPPLKM